MKKMTGQQLLQNFFCLVIGQKRPVMTDDRTLFPPLNFVTYLLLSFHGSIQLATERV